MELAATHEVLLATGRPRRVSPERILGRSIFWWMDKLGILRASREMRVGRHLMRTDPFPGKALGLGRLRRRGIRVGLGDCPAWMASGSASPEREREREGERERRPRLMP